MGLELRYTNDLGEVVIYGDGQGSVRLCGFEGFGPVDNEYNSVVYAGYDGQETISQRAIARTITMALELNCNNKAKMAKNIFEVLSKPGVLYINSQNLDRRISCTQTKVSDIKRVLKGQITTFAVQLICDSPYFEDAKDTVVPLYQRTKLLSTPFALPTMFGDIVIGSTIEILGTASVEPTITMYYPKELSGAENITITNKTTGKAIVLDYAPKADEVVTIDVKKRKIIGSISGNIINCLSTDTFLGDFVLKRGLNVLTIDAGDVSSGFLVKCTYNNLYGEAVII